MGSPFQNVHSPGLIIKIASSIYGAAISGPSAVIVFFVISGLCIHFNYRTGNSIDYFSYYMRRYIRIGLPLTVALAFTILVSHRSVHSLSIASLNDSVLWSLIAELIYYTIYPALMYAKRRFGWQIVLLIAFVSSYAVVLGHPRLALEGHYADFGWKLNWLVGLPCWLLGCLLAERLPLNNSEVSTRAGAKYAIWMWRCGILAASCIAKTLQFHQHGHHFHFGYSLTLNLFAILVFFWLRNEISYYQHKKPLSWLERAGAGSYSFRTYAVDLV